MEIKSTVHALYGAWIVLIQYIEKGIVEQNKLNEGGNNILSYELLGSDKTFHWRLVFGLGVSRAKVKKVN